MPHKQLGAQSSRVRPPSQCALRGANEGQRSLTYGGGFKPLGAPAHPLRRATPEGERDRCQSTPHARVPPRPPRHSFRALPTSVSGVGPGRCPLPTPKARNAADVRPPPTAPTVVHNFRRSRTLVAGANQVVRYKGWCGAVGAGHRYSSLFCNSTLLASTLTAMVSKTTKLGGTAKDFVVAKVAVGCALHPP